MYVAANNISCDNNIIIKRHSWNIFNIYCFGRTKFNLNYFIFAKIHLTQFRACRGDRQELSILQYLPFISDTIAITNKVINKTSPMLSVQL